MTDNEATIAILTVFHEGEELDNAAAWKNWQVLGNHLIALLAAVVTIAHNLGYNIPLDQGQITNIGGAIAGLTCVANSLLTVITSSKIGLKPTETPLPNFKL